MISLISELPEEIFRTLQTYLSYDDYHYFLNTSKQLFASLKRKTIYFALNRKRSIQYLTDIDFQTLLLSKVENGWEQIRVVFERSSPPIPLDLPIHEFSAPCFVLPVSYWNNYKSIVCRGGEGGIEIPAIPNVEKLQVTLSESLSRESINLSALSHLSKLTIHDLQVEDISALKDIPDLYLSSCNRITDFSMLCNQRKLRINCCDELKDVAGFKFIRSLILFNCVNISDVSPLKGIYDLQIAYCREVKDISCLGNHHHLLINRLADDLTGYDCLLHIPHVSLFSCNIANIEVLRDAKSVHLSRCSKVSDVSALRNVNKVHIQGSRMLLGLSELQTVPDLTLEFESLELVSQEVPVDVIIGLQNKRLELRFDSCAAGINGLSMFSKKIEHLTISGCERIAGLINEGQGSSLQYLTSLTLDSMDIESVEGLGNIPTVKLSGCNSLRDLRGLGRNRYVEVSFCSELQNVSSLATVPIVTIKYCVRLTEESYECLRNVPRLKVVQFAPPYYESSMSVFGGVMEE